MKTAINTLFILCFFVNIGCNGKTNQSNITKDETSKDEIQPMKIVNLGSNQDINIDSLIKEQLYSVGEINRGVFAKLSSDSSTIEKLYTERLGKDSLCIKLYHQKARIIAVVYRIINSENEKIYNNAFYFDENNHCIANTIKDKDEITYDYLMYWGSLVKCDGNYNRMNIDSFQKQQIIESTKASLDSIMQHFPEFKYSFNWK